MRVLIGVVVAVSYLLVLVFFGVGSPPVHQPIVLTGYSECFVQTGPARWAGIRTYNTTNVTISRETCN